MVERPDIARRRNRWSDVAYYAFGVLVLAFGVLGILTIGAPFVVLGALMIGLGPNRHRPEVLLPPIVGVIAWTATFVLLFPGSCEVSGSGEPGTPAIATAQTCRSVAGARIPGGGVTALVTASVVGVGLALGVRAMSARRARARRVVPARPD